MADLRDLLEELVGPQAGIDMSDVHDRITIRRRRRRARNGGVAAIAAIVIVLAGLLVVGRNDSERLEVVGPASTTSGVVRNSSVLVFVSGRDGLSALDPATGVRRPLDVGVTGGWCETCAVARAGDGLVFVAGDQAYWLATLDSRAVNIGAAHSVYEATEPGSVWLFDGTTMRRVDAATRTELAKETPPDKSSPAPEYSAAGAAIPEGLVLRSVYAQGEAGQITLWNPATRTTTWKSGFNAWFVAAGSTPEGALIAWVRSDCDRSGARPADACDLHISNVTRGTDVVVATPPNTLGYIRGGRFSPRGDSLAAFAYTSPSWAGNPAADLVMIDFQSNAATMIAGSHIRIGEPVVAAVWSADGTRLYFTGVGQAGKSYEPGAASALDLPGAINYSVTALASKPSNTPGPRSTPPATASTTAGTTR